MCASVSSSRLPKLVNISDLKFIELWIEHTISPFYNYPFSKKHKLYFTILCKCLFLPLHEYVFSLTILNIYSDHCLIYAVTELPSFPAFDIGSLHSIYEEGSTSDACNKNCNTAKPSITKGLFYIVFVSALVSKYRYFFLSITIFLNSVTSSRITTLTPRKLNDFENRPWSLHISVSILSLYITAYFTGNIFLH
ncbi:hypothetical protein MTR67_032710 [Solanum verrucosum]|uniref:Uncharacterized protein n=1 Tax=Solanum verrucosum TaxID=315347 RepID=A0AAF0U4Q5_SOLVR|nr:hypothetical protein MTR67_032710 [Solanum verrucosum]